MKNFPLDANTLNLIREAIDSSWDVDPETGDHIRVDSSMGLYELLEFISGSNQEDSVDDEHNSMLSYVDVETYVPNDIILALIDEVFRLREKISALKDNVGMLNTLITEEI